jgi:hypothetical protein
MPIQVLGHAYLRQEHDSISVELRFHLIRNRSYYSSPPFLRSGLGFIRKDSCYIRGPNEDFFIWKDEVTSYDFKEKLVLVSQGLERQVKAVLRLNRSYFELMTFDKFVVARIKNEEF